MTAERNSTLRILVIDDSPTVHQYVRLQLAPYGIEVDHLDNFVALSRYMRETPPNLILLDLEMPAISGTAFATFIRKTERRPTPILIHSSRPTNELEQAAREINAAGFVQKGTRDDQFRILVRTHLGRAEAQQTVAPRVGTHP